MDKTIVYLTRYDTVLLHKAQRSNDNDPFSADEPHFKTKYRRMGAIITEYGSLHASSVMGLSKFAIYRFDEYFMGNSTLDTVSSAQRSLFFFAVRPIWVCPIYSIFQNPNDCVGAAPLLCRISSEPFRIYTICNYTRRHV